MQADALRTILWIEVTVHRIGDHGVQFGERITLRGDSATPRRIPARDVTTGFGARLDLENDFNNLDHGRKLNPRPGFRQPARGDRAAPQTAPDGEVDFQVFDFEERVHSMPKHSK